MLAELRPTVLSERSAEFAVRNSGVGVAKSVRVSFDPPLLIPDDGGAGLVSPFLVRKYEHPIPTVTPGMELVNIYQTMDARGTGDEPVPNDFTVTIDYKDRKGRPYTDKYELSVSTLMNSTYIRPSNTDPKGMERRRVAALEAIARGVGR